MSSNPFSIFHLFTKKDTWVMPTLHLVPKTTLVSYNEVTVFSLKKDYRHRSSHTEEGVQTHSLFLNLSLIKGVGCTFGFLCLWNLCRGRGLNWAGGVLKAEVYGRTEPGVWQPFSYPTLGNHNTTQHSRHSMRIHDTQCMCIPVITIQCCYQVWQRIGIHMDFLLNTSINIQQI